MNKAFLITLFVGAFLFSRGQTPLSDEERRYFKAAEDTLAHLVQLSVRAGGEQDKIMINTAFTSLLDEVLDKNNSWAWPFDSLVKFRMLLNAPDQEMRIMTWSLPLDDGSYRYYGYIQRMDPATKKWSVFRLEDKSEEIRKPEMATVGAEKWYGCYYFKLVETYYDDKRYYTLLGWDGYSKLTQKRIIDLLWFNASGEPQFGDAVFEVRKVMGKTDREITVWQKRIIFEFKQLAIMALDFDEKKHLIVYEHLSPEESWEKDQFQYYVPDLGLDGLKFKKGKWYYVKDAKVRNSRTNTDKYYKKPTRDPNAPAGH
jgi:hypothetical protein